MYNSSQSVSQIRRTKESKRRTASHHINPRTHQLTDSTDNSKGKDGRKYKNHKQTNIYVSSEAPEERRKNNTSFHPFPSIHLQIFHRVPSCPSSFNHTRDHHPSPRRFTPPKNAAITKFQGRSRGKSHFPT